MITKILEKRRMKRLLAMDAQTLSADERDELRFLQDKHGAPGAAADRASTLAGYGERDTKNE
jgi:hypothetical protein